MHWKSGRRLTAAQGASSTVTTTTSGISSAEDEATSSDSLPPPTMSPLSDGTNASLLNIVKWCDEGEYLKDFLQNHHTLPQVARIIKGQYLTLGVSTLSSSSSLHQTVFLCSRAKRLKVAAQCVKFKEGKKVVPIGPRLAIPDNYEGWFEILSEEGKAVRCIESVAELARRFPDSCLVRENVKAYVAKGDELEIITDRVRTISAGETLVLLSEVMGSSANPDKTNSDARKESGGKGRFLRCFDAKGENVYLSFDQRGKFSLVAKEDNISGVHSIKNLLTKRFPIMVRLVTGKTPLGGKIGSNFAPEMRLFASFEEECVMALPLHTSAANPKVGDLSTHMVAVPITTPLKLQASKNAELFQTIKEYEQIQDRCKTLIEDAADKIQVFEVDNTSGKEQSRPEVALYRKLPYFRRAFSDPNGYRPQRHRSTSALEIDNNYRKRSESDLNGDSGSPSDQEHDDRYNEIDQIYDYVRGFAPLPKSAETNVKSGDEEDVGQEVGENKERSSEEDETAEDKSKPEESTKPPDPPPIETIPARNQRLAHTVHPVRVVQVTSSHKRPAIENHYERIPRVGVGRFYSRESRSAGSKLSKLYAIKNGGNGGHQRHNGSLNSSNNNNSAIKTSSAKLFRQHQRIGGSGTGSGGLIAVTGRGEPTYPVIGIRGSVKSSTTSPLFNIRYKSLTNLTSLEFNTLDSSNSGGGLTSNASSYIIEECGPPPNAVTGRKAHKKQFLHLGRPKSLTSFGLLQCKDNRNYQFHYHQQQKQPHGGPPQQRHHQLILSDYNRANLINNVMCGGPIAKPKEQKDKNILISAANNNNSLKRIGTLYL